MMKLIEMKKVSGLINEKGYIPIMVDNKITLLIKGHKTYRPKHDMYIQ